MKDIIDVMELFRVNDIEFYSVKENPNNKDIMGKLMMNMLMCLNEFEVESIRERIRGVKRNNKDNGLVYGKLMYGNDKDGKKSIDNIEEMKCIEYMKILRSRGRSYFSISDKLNQKEIKTKPNKRWYGKSLSNVLSYYK